MREMENRTVSFLARLLAMLVATIVALTAVAYAESLGGVLVPQAREGAPGNQIEPNVFKELIILCLVVIGTLLILKECTKEKEQPENPEPTPEPAEPEPDPEEPGEGWEGASCESDDDCRGSCDSVSIPACEAGRCVCNG